MENELLKLSSGFFKQNKGLVLGAIVFSVFCSTIESIIIPNTVAGTFNSLGNNVDAKNNPEFKKQIITLVLSWVGIKLAYAISNYFRKKVEPAITQYVTVELIKQVFKKFEVENEMFNVSVVTSKVTLIKKNIQEIFYIFSSVFIPRVLVIILSCYNFYLIDKNLAFLIAFLLLIQGAVVTMGLTSCINKTFEEQEDKDRVYEYIEDIFNNITTLQSTPHSFDNELNEIRKITLISKEMEEKSYDCINMKQYHGYATNILIFSIVIYQIYTMYTSGYLPKEKVTKTLLSLTGLFENIYEMTYYVPEVSYKLGVLKNNEQFLRDLMLVKNENASNDELNLEKGFVIEFANVTFQYSKKDKTNHLLLNDFNIVFPECKIICLFGPSGSGKSTFIRLIFGIEKPINGTIFIGGNDISKYKLNELRKNIAYINQNTTNLFNRSLFENILYGYYSKEDIEASKDELVERMKEIFTNFNFYEIFKNLDENKEKWTFLNESVGKLGQNLSGGQKQIVHLLRIAFNKVAKIVILDEPTSALDEVSRNAVLNFVKYLNTLGKSIFIITHDAFYKDICYSKLQFFQDKNPEFTA